MRKTILALMIGGAVLAGCAKKTTLDTSAPGAPGKPSLWSYSGKTGIGTSYEKYTDDGYSDSGSTGTLSKVWFSVAQGVLTETMYGLIH